MQTQTIITEIQKLSFSKQIYIAEMVLKSVRQKEAKNQMELAAELLYDEYATNKELTIFTNLDMDTFYEAAK